MPDPETPEVPGETLDPQAQGITETPDTDSPNAGEPEKPADQAAVEESPEELKKRLAQAQMELNQKRNALAEIEKQKEEARLAELSEVERLREQLAQREEEDNRREAEALRLKFIESYDDPKVVEAAKKLLEQNPANLSWGDVDNEDDAKAAIHRQMDALRSIIPAAPEPTDGFDGEVSPNNPEYLIGDVDITKLSADEMRKLLPKAPPR